MADICFHVSVYSPVIGSVLIALGVICNFSDRLQQLRIYATDLAKFDHGLVRIVLLDDLLIVFGVLQLDMLVQAALGAIAFWAVLDRAFVVARNLSGRPPMPLLLFIVNFEWHVENLLVLSLIRLKSVNGDFTYLESIQLVTEILLLVKQLLEPIGQNDVGVVKPAILLVKVMVIVYYFFVAALAGRLR